MAERLSATIVLTGDVMHAAFPGWIARHAQKLGLTGVTSNATAQGLEVQANGVEEMIQALALGASLGPDTVLVEIGRASCRGRV